MNLVIIAVENLRIGGYQRLALDQAYYLSDRAQRCLLLMLNPESPGLKSFESTEKNLIRSKGLVTSRLSGKRLKDFFEIRRILKLENLPVLVISHSMRSTVLFAIARTGLKQKIFINTTIHQLPSLSRFIQRLKRFLYSQFGDKIYAYSDAVQKDWQNRYTNLGKPISILRNGIYKERLNINEFGIGSKSPRLIFLGRNTSWKGIDIYLSLFQLPIFSEYQGLMMIAKSSTDIKNAVNKVGLGRIEIIEGANLSNFQPQENDLHVYPSQYGENAKYTEPISLNCLEMALLGIPSLVTPSGENTWPELSELGVFIPVEWERIEDIQTDLKKKIQSISMKNRHEISELISISKNVEAHLKVLD